jgi:Protein of unknown function (DUF3108)
MIRWRPLLLLTAVVLAVHGCLLRPAAGVFRTASGARPKPLVTRTVPSPVQPNIAVAAPTALAANLATPAVTPLPPRAGGKELGQRRRTVASFTAAKAVSAAELPPSPKPSPAERFALTVPGSMLLHYKVTAHTRGLVLNAESQLRWRHEGNEYEAKLELSGPLFPSRTQQSTGRVTAEGLAPLRFSDKARSEEAAHFEREDGKVSFSSNRPDAPLMAGAQDRLSVLMQLGAMIAAKPKNFGPGATISVQTASTREAEVWQFTIQAEETLRLPGGDLATLKLMRNPRKEFDQKIELWLAPSMDYVPVRLRLTQPNGDWVDQQWSSTDKG